MANKISMKTNGNIWEVVLDGNPILTGFDAPVGSLAIDQSTGEEYYKFDTGSTDWKSNATDDELDAEVLARQNADTNLQSQVDVLKNVDIVTKEPTGFLNRTDSTFSFNSGTRTFSIQPVSTSFDVYIKGQKITINSTLSIQIPNTSGNYYLYIDSNGAIQYTNVFSQALLSDYVYCVYIYWNATTSQLVSMGDERHGLVMDHETHIYLHTTRGAQLVSGATISYTTVGTGASNADAQIQLGDMTIRDEDILISISNNATPSSFFQQILSPIAKIPTYYRVGTEWRKDTSTDYPLKQGTNRSQFNKNTAGVWSVQDATVDNYFLVSYVFATNNVSEPVVAILGQDEYSTLNLAKENAKWSNVDFGDLPSPEMKLLYIVFYETSSLFSNTPKSAIRYVSDYRYGSDRETSAIPSVTSHSTLSNLDADTHLQYLPLTGSRAMTGDLDVGSNNIKNINTEQFIEQSTVPSAPLLGIKTFSRKIGLRNMLAVIGKSGLDYTLQPHIGRNKIMLWQANGNSTNSTIIGNAVSATGTTTTRNVATTNLFNSMRRLGYVSTTNAGNSAGLRTTALQFWRGNASDRGGFHFICRFGISDASAVATGRTFVGLTSTTTAIGNVNPSTLLNSIGIGNDDTDTNMQIIYNDGVGTASKINLGASFPANTRSTDMFEVVFFSPPNGSAVYYQVTNLTTGVSTEGTLTTDIPASTQLLALQAWRNNGTTALAVGLDIVNIYCETDN